MAPPTTFTSPGVYVAERDTFPAAAVGVPTAIPAFIGYTEKAEWHGKPVDNKPTRITSLVHYEQCFGAGFRPLYTIEEVVPDTPPGGDPPVADYDFSCRRRSETSPPQWTLKYYKLCPLGAAHSPLPPFNLYNALRLFYANGGDTCYVVSVGTYGERSSPTAVRYDALKRGLDAIGAQPEPTMLVVPDAMLLPARQAETPTSAEFDQLCRDMLKQCRELRDRMAILDVYGGETLDQHAADWDRRLESLAEAFRNGVGHDWLDYGASYLPCLMTSLVDPDAIDYTNINIQDDAQRKLLQAILDDQAERLYAPDATRHEAVKGYIADIATTTEPDGVIRLNRTLVGALPLLAEMEAAIAQKMPLAPPSGAMAGVFALTDATRGVWSAPVNVMLNAVVAPLVTLNDAQQNELNTPLDGKAINAIRQFATRGTVAWGARTLDGNSGDWRFISARRTLIYIEQSIKATLAPFAFAANDSKTWNAVVSIVSNFLTDVWLQGGLTGMATSDAYSVACGLGATMTAQDIEDSYLIVQIAVAPIYPAEFIVITIRQRMQAPA